MVLSGPHLQHRIAFQLRRDVHHGLRRRAVGAAAQCPLRAAVGLVAEVRPGVLPEAVEGEEAVRAVVDLLVRPPATVSTPPPP
jgi:hypothetical protein